MYFSNFFKKVDYVKPFVLFANGRQGGAAGGDHRLFEENNDSEGDAEQEAEASRFEVRAKGEVEEELRRAPEAEAERRGIIEAEARTGE